MRSNISVRIPAARRFGAVALVGVALIGACQDQTDTGFVGAPAHVVVLAGSQISGQVGDTLGPFVVGVTDTAGTPVTGVPITFTITGQGTLVTTSATTDKDGSALTSVAFSHTVGNVTITATAQGVPTPAVINTFVLRWRRDDAFFDRRRPVADRTAKHRSSRHADRARCRSVRQSGFVDPRHVRNDRRSAISPIRRPALGADGRVASLFTLPPAAGGADGHRQNNIRQRHDIDGHLHRDRHLTSTHCPCIALRTFSAMRTACCACTVSPCSASTGANAPYNCR